MHHHHGGARFIGSSGTEELSEPMDRRSTTSGVAMRLMVLAIVTGSVIVLLGFGALYVKQERRATRELAVLRAEVAQLRETQLSEDSDAARLKHMVALAAKARNAQQLQPLAVPSTIDGSVTEPQHGHGPQVPSSPPVSPEQSREFVDSAYEEEAPDASWSLPASRQLEALVQRSLPSQGALRSVACRSTLCRIEISLASSQDLMAFGLVAFRDWPGSIFLANETHDRNGLQATYYASREGTEPPLNGL
ncbi:MAG: hypothetical protein QM784_37960 [Polyangiaceae bacterium]